VFLAEAFHQGVPLTNLALEVFMRQILDELAKPEQIRNETIASCRRA